MRSNLTSPLFKSPPASLILEKIMLKNNLKYSTSFPAAICEKLKFYVYIYIDIEREEVVYVGKGTGNRCFDHLSNITDDKAGHIQKLVQNKMLRIDILVYGVDETVAIKVEAAVIDLVGIDSLLNKQRGHESSKFGRISTEDLIAELSRSKISIDEFDNDSILIRINKHYYSGMSEHELYEATRGIWVVSEKSCQKVKYAMAVYGGIIREVYSIAAWFPEGATMYSTRSPQSEKQNRFEFVGRIADDIIRQKFLHKYVGHLWGNGTQNPITYFGPSFNK